MKTDISRLTRRSLTIGVILWGVLLAAVAAGKAPFGFIEILFLFAPLVIVPMGLELGALFAPVSWQWTLDLARSLQAGAALSAVAAFWMPPGLVAGLLVIPWVVVCSLIALAGLSSFRLTGQSLGQLAANISRVDLAIAAGWLLLSRLGIRPLGFQEPIVLLTAVHFHYTGFATALIAGATVSFARHHGRASRACSTVVVFILVLPFLLAAGFVFSPLVKACAAVLLAAAMLGLAIAQLWACSLVPRSPAKPLLWISSASVISAMGLAGVYAVGEFMGKDWILIPRMATTHGLLNALGFVLPGLVGWSVAWLSNESRMRLPITKFEKAATVWFPQD